LRSMTSTTSPLPAVPPEMSPWKSHTFRSVWIANLASHFGVMIQAVAAAWVMTQLGGSTQMVALIQTASTLPIVLFSLWTGALADGYERRLILIAAQSFMLIASAMLAIYAALGLLTPWLLLTFTFLIASGMAVKIPTIQAALSDMVPREALPAAVAMNGMGFNVARSLGPAIGGIVVAGLGAASAFILNAASYIGLIIVLFRWKEPAAPRSLPAERLGNAVVTGLHYVAMSPDICTVLLRVMVFGIAGSATTALMPLIALHLLGGGPLTYGLLLGAFGLGAVGGAFATARLRQRLSNEGLVRLSVVAMIVSGLVSAISPYLAVTLTALLIGGAGWVIAYSTFNLVVQTTSPRWVVARTLSIYQIANFAGLACGSAAFGWLAERQGVSTSLLVAAALQLASVGLGAVRKLPFSNPSDLDPLDHFEEPATVVPVEARTGPVDISLEYRIAPERVTDFLSAMTVRKRIRCRDGAKRWRLYRDLSEADLWTERYHVATWLDYLRHNSRRTKADLANLELLRSLQDDGVPIRIRRAIGQQPGHPGLAETDAQRTRPEVTGDF